MSKMEEGDVKVNPFLIDLVLDLILTSFTQTELKCLRSVNSQWNAKCVHLLNKSELSPIKLYEVSSDGFPDPKVEKHKLKLLMKKFLKFPNRQLFRSFEITGNQLKTLKSAKFLPKFRPKSLSIMATDGECDYFMSFTILNLLTTCSTSLQSLHLKFGIIHLGFLPNMEYYIENPEAARPPYRPHFPNLESLTLSMDPCTSDAMRLVLNNLLTQPTPKLRAIHFEGNIPKFQIVFLDQNPFFKVMAEEAFWDNIQELSLDRAEIGEIMTLFFVKLTLKKLSLTRIIHEGSLNIEFNMEKFQGFTVLIFHLIIEKQAATLEELSLGINMIFKPEPNENVQYIILKPFPRLRKLFYGICGYSKENGRIRPWDYVAPFDFNEIFPRLEHLILDTDFWCILESINITKDHPLKSLIWNRLTPVSFQKLGLAFPSLKYYEGDIYVLRGFGICWAYPNTLEELVLWNKSGFMNFDWILEILEELGRKLKALVKIKLVGFEINKERKIRIQDLFYPETEIIFENSNQNQNM